jgi:hypothetical protein
MLTMSLASAARIFTDDRMALCKAVCYVRTNERDGNGERGGVDASERRAPRGNAARDGSLARIHAARTVEAAKDAARRIRITRSCAERVRPQREWDLAFE